MSENNGRGRDGRPPNVVLVITDQHRPDHTGFGGNAVIDTPHLDRLAAGATVFDRAIVANPICMPNRATIMTSRVPSVHGTRFNGISLDWGANTFVRSLRDAGYATGLVGKAHFQNMGHGAEFAGPLFPAAQDAFTTAWPEDWDQYENAVRHRGGVVAFPPDWYGFDHVDLVVDHSDEAGGHYHQWLKEHGVDPAAIQGPAHRRQSVDVGWDQIYQPELPEELYPTTYVAERSVAFLERAAAAPDPFFLQVSFPDPHHPFTPPGRYYDRYEPGEIVLPRTFDDPHERSMRHIRRMVAHRGGPSSGLRIEPFACTEEQYREAAAKEYGMITMIDDAVGQVLDAMARVGVWDDTVIIFTSDHGDMFGDHGLMLKGNMHYEGCVHVPLVVSTPQSRATGTDVRTRSLAGSIDLAPTILELTGCAPFHGMQGHSLVPVLDDPAATVRDAVLVEEDEIFDLLGTGRPMRLRTIISDAGRLTRYEHAEHGELFDHATDPDEMDNRFGRTEGAALQGALTEQLLNALIEHADDAPKPTHFA